MPQPSPNVVTVNYATEPKTATPGSDYVSQLGTLTFPAGTTRMPVRIQIVTDNIVETIEELGLRLSRPTNATLLDDYGLGKIGNDDLARLRVTGSEQSEGDDGTRVTSFTIESSNPAAMELRVTAATQDGTATVGDSDYVAFNQTVVFAPGETKKNILVTINSDRKFEPDETFGLVISDPQGGATLIDTATANAVIRNDDAALGAVGGTVRIDTNANGQFDDGEPGLGGSTVFADLDGNLTLDPGEPFAVTTESGRYRLENVIAGEQHVLQVVRENWLQSYPGSTTQTDAELFVTVTVVAGGVVTGADFGNITTVNADPTLDEIANPSAIDQDSGPQTIALSGISAGEGENQSLTITATCSNLDLIADLTVDYASPHAVGTLTFTPLAGKSGNATIAVRVRDAGPNGIADDEDDANIERNFDVSVNALN